MKSRIHACKTDGSQEGTWTAAFAVACDGGRSFIRKTLGIGYEGDVQKENAYWAGQFFSIHMRIPDLYPKYVGHRRAWMYWAVNPDPNTRGVIIALNGQDEFMMLVKPKGGKTDVDRDEVADWVQAGDRHRHPGACHCALSVERGTGARRRALQGRTHHDRR